MLSLIKKNTLAYALLGAIFVSVLIVGLVQVVQVHANSTQVPGVTLHTINPAAGTQDYYTFFTATTTTATSTTAATSQDPGFARIGGAADVIFFFSRGDTKGTGNSGSSLFKVQVTPDGVNWYDYNELGAVTVSPNESVFFTRVGTTTITAATSTVMFAMEDIDYYGVRCITVRTTNGEASCSATISFPGTF